MQYIYTQNPNSDRPIILVDRLIGTGVDEINGGQFTREILALQNSGVKEAEVWINSKGGLWSEGVSIVSAMNNSSIAFTTINMGFADSTGGHVFQAGQRREWMPYAVGLIHEIQGSGMPETIEAMNESVATMLCSKTNKSASEVRALMAANTVMGPKMAQDYGFCDEVKKIEGINILQFTNSSDAYEAGQNQIKKLLSKTHNMNSTINEILGLQNEASPAAQAAAITGILNAKNIAEQALQNKEVELNTVRESLVATTQKLNAAQETILKSTNEAKRTAAEVMVKGYVGTHIADDPDVIATWVEQAFVNPDATKTMLESTNLNRQAPDPLKHIAGQTPAADIAMFMAMKDAEKKKKKH